MAGIAVEHSGHAGCWLHIALDAQSDLDRGH